jgi:hypothetical protein
MTETARPVITGAYIIYSADVLGSESFIEDMSPARHLPAGFREGTWRRRVREIVASRFVQTEGDEEYEYGYLGKESGDVRWFPAGYLDAAATKLPDDGYDGDAGEGRHRKWAGELTGAEWRIFADAYLIDLDGDGLPERYEETLGMLTLEYGAIGAVSVDNREGWDDYHGTVIDSTIYANFMMSGPACQVCGGLLEQVDVNAPGEWAHADPEPEDRHAPVMPDTGDES